MSNDKFPIADYYPFSTTHHNTNMDEIEKLHKLIVDFHGQYIGNPELQKFLYTGFNEPIISKNYADIFVQNQWDSHNVKISLGHLEKLLAVIQTPEFFVDESPHFEIFPAVVGSLEEAIDEVTLDERRTQFGVSEEQTQMFREIWYHALSSDDRKNVLDFRTTLWNCASQFDLKFLLTQVNNKAKDSHSRLFDESELRKRIDDAFTIGAYTALDSAYYNRGRHLKHPVADSYELLAQEDSATNFFILTPDEIQEIQGMMIKGCYEQFYSE